jgi:hypothetical protein
MKAEADRQREPAFAERERLRGSWLEEFNDGARCGFSGQFPGSREAGGYPRGFHQWPRDKRNAWYAGFNVGFHDRLHSVAERAGG